MNETKENDFSGFSEISFNDYLFLGDVLTIERRFN